MFDVARTRSGRFVGLMNEVERTKPSRITARRLRALRDFLFVGCVPDDETRLKPVLDMIERDGHVLWIDHAHLPSGPSYARDAAAALYACRAMVVFCSAGSYASANVRGEIVTASKLDKPIVPIVVDDAQMPDAFMFYLGRWPIIRMDDPHWKVRLRSATEALARGKRVWQGSPPVSAECAPILVVS
jgi:hypothetical protein